MASKKLCHNNQLSMLQIVSNCDKRAIGSNGGFGYRSIRDDLEIGLMDSMILADWLADTTHDTKKKQKSIIRAFMRNHGCFFNTLT